MQKGNYSEIVWRQREPVFSANNYCRISKVLLFLNVRCVLF